ncbi:MAG: trypsin-like peptidase domain-containing protein [Thermoguttaceae bacterium]
MRTVRTMIFWLLAMLPATCRRQTVLYDFYAEWCGPCRAMSVTIDQLACDGYVVERIDVDRQPALARQFEITSIPCFVVVEGGKELDRIVGQTSIERLKLKLDRHLPFSRAPKGSAGPGKKDPPERRPHPAWRYEQPVGHRAAVVRIYCQDDARTRSIGSGTLVRWGAKKIVVLTARHVVADAKKIVVELFNKKTYKARVLKVDAVWDCAVLELDGRPQGVKAVEVELGDDAVQHEGNRLESCGYGPDGKLAVNTGVFLGYRRSTQAPNGPDDWFEISGHARPGDSGGGVFNERGRLVGVLWGTNGEVVVGVQAGRLHLLLDSALPETIEQKAFVLTQLLQRNPTPPKPAAIESLPPACDCGSGCCPLPGPILDEPPAENTGAKKRDGAVLPWRGKAQQRDEELDARSRNLLDAIEAERRARLAAERSQPPPAHLQPLTPESNDNAASPLVTGLVIAVALAVGGIFYRVTRRTS